MTRIVGSDTYALSHDAENRLTGVTKNGVSVATFVYGTGGERIKGTVSGVTTVYVGNHYEVQGDTIRKGRTAVRPYAGPQRVAVRENGVLYWLLTDHLGSTAITANGTTGAWVGEVRYKAWGEERPACGSPPCGTTPTTYRYTGQRAEAGIGLYFYNARWYDPALGRFVQADTIVPQPGGPQSLNRYSYVRNDPVRFVDPSGHMECLDEECNWQRHPVSGHVRWRGPGTAPLPSERYLYSEEYGYFDKQHLNTGKPAQVIADVKAAIAAGGGPVHVEQPIQRGLAGYFGDYFVSGEATPEQAIGIAFGIYQDWSIRFEAWEGRGLLGLWGQSSFAIEDLPSHYVGFYAAAKGLDPGEVFMNLGGVEGRDTEPPRGIQNREFTPKVGGVNVPWPKEMSITAVDMGSSTWWPVRVGCWPWVAFAAP